MGEGFMRLRTKRPSRPARRALGGFRRDERGGVAIMFALGFIPLAILSLVAIDYARASTAKQALQEALDAATLLAARTTSTESDYIDEIGDKALAAQLTAARGLNGLTPDGAGRIANATFSLDGQKIVATVNASIEPLIAKMFLGQSINIAANSEVVRAGKKIEIALVLDTTGSMEGTKLSNLVTAAKNFVTKMETAANRTALVDGTKPIRISLVPFSTTVKVVSPIDLKNYNATTHSGAAITDFPDWVDGRAQGYAYGESGSKKVTDIFTTANTDRFAMLKQMGLKWEGCVEARPYPYDTQDDAPTSANTATLVTPFFWPDEPDQLDTGSTDSQSSGTRDSKSAYRNDYLSDGVTGKNNWSARQGAVAKYNTKTFKSGAAKTFTQGSGYGADLNIGPNAGCAMQQLRRLTTDYGTLRTDIDGLVASGETNIPLGLQWGWFTLSPYRPFKDGVAYNTQGYMKVLILMTDGDNTMNDAPSNNSNNSWYHGYGYQWQNKLNADANTGDTATTKLNRRMTKLCANIKNSQHNIEIYTIGVGVSSSSKTLLQGCASGADHYYDVNSTGGNLDAAFSAIAGAIENLRISK